jgi:hypothetical protein
LAEVTDELPKSQIAKSYRSFHMASIESWEGIDLGTSVDFVHQVELAIRNRALKV